MVRRLFGRAACLLLLTIFSNAGLQAGQAAVTVPPELIAAGADVERDARILKAYLPVYPWDAVQNGVDGWVTLGFVIDEIGFVQDIQVLAAQPQGVFDQAAISALARWDARSASSASIPCGTTQQGGIVTFTFDHDQNPKRLMTGGVTLDILSLLNPAASSKQTECVAGSCGTLDSGIKILRRVSPRYVYEAIRERISGVVTVVFEVPPDGKPTDIHVVQSIPPGLFDHNTIEALKISRFKPAMRNGKAVTRSACQRTVFRNSDRSIGWFGPPGIGSPSGIPYGSVTAPPVP